ncbi:MAG: hypothetical protein WBF87_03185 [Mesorhizobium sp.]
MARLKAAACAALPGAGVALSGSVLWSMLMALLALNGLVVLGWKTPGHIALVAAVYAAGGFLAFAPSVWLGRLLGSRRREAVAAATFLALATATIGLTALLFALQYRVYYAQWHGDTFTVRWAFEFAFTSAAAVYQFLVTGVRLYMPLGLLALFGVSWWNARHVR